MKKMLQHFFQATPWTSNLARMPAQLPVAIIALGVAITPLWAGVLAWFLVHWLVQFWH